MRRASDTTYAYQLHKIKRLFPVPGFQWRDYGFQELKQFCMVYGGRSWVGNRGEAGLVGV